MIDASALSDTIEWLHDGCPSTPTAGEASTTDDDDPVSLCSSSRQDAAACLLAPATAVGR